MVDSIECRAQIEKYEEGDVLKIHSQQDINFHLELSLCCALHDMLIEAKDTDPSAINLLESDRTLLFPPV